MVQYGERHFLIVSGTPIKYHQEITRLQQAINQHPDIAVVHCKGHQKGADEVSEWNRLANAASNSSASSTTPVVVHLVWDGSITQERP